MSARLVKIALLGMVAACGKVVPTTTADAPRTVDAPPPPLIDAPVSQTISVTSSVADGGYGTGSQIPIEVTFPETVTVMGTPQLVLDSTATPVPYTSGSGTATLTFTYTVAFGDSAAHLDYASTSALLLAGGTISETAGAASLTLPAPGAAGSLSANKAIAIATGTMTYNFTGGLQTFTVPANVASVKIDASGAEGGTSTGQVGGMAIVGGNGARAVGTFTVTPAQAISVLVGGVGANSDCGSGGGGGSWAVSGPTLLLVAGGGGGGFECTALGAIVGVGGNTTTTGGTGSCTVGRTATAGGTAGAGGTAFFGGGGGGWSSAGVSTEDSAGGGGVYPGGGGNIGGGYGGGGGYYTSCCGGSGGGGGYSGGGGGTSDGCAGGGGASYNSGTAQTNTAATHTGPGQVIVSW